MKVMFNISTPLCVNFALETESSADLPPTQHSANQRTESDPRSELRHPSLFTNITVAPFFSSRLFMGAERDARSSDVKDKNLSLTV